MRVVHLGGSVVSPSEDGDGCYYCHIGAKGDISIWDCKLLIDLVELQNSSLTLY